MYMRRGLTEEQTEAIAEGVKNCLKELKDKEENAVWFDPDNGP